MMDRLSSASVRLFAASASASTWLRVGLQAGALTFVVLWSAVAAGAQNSKAAVQWFDAATLGKQLETKAWHQFLSPGSLRCGMYRLAKGAVDRQ